MAQGDISVTANSQANYCCILKTSYWCSKDSFNIISKAAAGQYFVYSMCDVFCKLNPQGQTLSKQQCNRKYNLNFKALLSHSQVFFVDSLQKYQSFKEQPCILPLHAAVTEQLLIVVA